MFLFVPGLYQCFFVRNSHLIRGCVQVDKCLPHILVCLSMRIGKLRLSLLQRCTGLY